MEAPICGLVDAMSRLPAKLDRLLRHGQMLPRGAEDEIPLIKEDLEKIMAILQGHGNPIAEDRAMMIGCLMKETRELSYDIDDCIDRYEQAAAGSRSMSASRVPRRKSARRGSKTGRLPERLKRRLWMANKIREFSVRSQEALQRYITFYPNGTGVGVGVAACRSRYDASFGPFHVCGEHADQLVGIDASLNKLEAWLAKDDVEQKLKFVSIVGSGGVGKTTLANQLYCRIGGQFECRAFVRSSRKPDIRRLLISMLSQVRPNLPPNNWKVHSLISHIRTHLQDKRYLIVVDDVWAASAWDIVNYALPDGNCYSRILITTEIEDVAQKNCGYDPRFVFKMKPLCEDDARKLFFNTVIAPPESSEVSNSIIRKCGGSPLATLTIASLLASRVSKPEQWDHVDKFLSYGLMAKPTLEGMKQVLNLSYKNLPAHLKACVLYLVIYQEGQIIWKDDLVKQWIAEGFICATEGNNEEEISGSYFDELISSRIIQPIRTNDTGEVLSCTVHYMVVDFIKHKSLEENFVTAIHHSETRVIISDKVRRLSLQFGNAEDATLPTNMRLSQVRTLAFFGVFSCLPSMVEFRLLQVLILQFWGDDETISLDLTRALELFRLRYLQVTCNCKLEVQAINLQGLKYLETLKIDARASRVPPDIIHLPHLLHLTLPADTNLPNGIGHMTSLRTLGQFDIGTNSTENMERLGELTNLRDLQLTSYAVRPENLKNNILCLGTILRQLRNLQSLTLVAVGSSCVNSQYVAGSERMSISADGLSNVFSPQALLRRLKLSPRVCFFSNLPKWIRHLCNLSILKIGVSELAGSDVDVLRGLPALTVLSLYVGTKFAAQIVFNQAGFSVINYLKIQCSVPLLKFEAGALPNLQTLKLGFNGPGADQHGTAAITIEHLSGLKDISAEIGGAGQGIDSESVLVSTIRNHPSNPRINIRLKDCTFYASTSTGTEEKECMNKNEDSGEDFLEPILLNFFEKDEQKQADRGIVTEPSSGLPMLGLKDTSAEVGGAGIDLESGLVNTIRNYPSNPQINIQLKDYNSHGHISTGTKEKTCMNENYDMVKDEKKQADSGIFAEFSLGLHKEEDIESVLKQAMRRWLEPPEIIGILMNHRYFRLAPGAPNRPPSGTLFLLNRRVNRLFRKDGHEWRMKKNGKTVAEAHERKKVGNVPVLSCYYAHGQENPGFQRRCYWMLEPAYEHIVLVHYLDKSKAKLLPQETQPESETAFHLQGEDVTGENSLDKIEPRKSNQSYSDLSSVTEGRGHGVTRAAGETIEYSDKSKTSKSTQSYSDLSSVTEGRGHGVTRAAGETSEYSDKSKISKSSQSYSTFSSVTEVSSSSANKEYDSAAKRPPKAGNTGLGL